MDAQKLREEFKGPLTPAHTLPEQNSFEKLMQSKSCSTEE